MILTEEQADANVFTKPNWRWQAAEFIVDNPRHPNQPNEQLILYAQHSEASTTQPTPFLNSFKK